MGVCVCVFFLTFPNREACLRGMLGFSGCVLPKSNFPALKLIIQTIADPNLQISMITVHHNIWIQFKVVWPWETWGLAMPSHILARADHQANLDLHGWRFSKFRRLQIAAFFPGLSAGFPTYNGNGVGILCLKLKRSQEDKPSNIWLSGTRCRGRSWKEFTSKGVFYKMLTLSGKSRLDVWCPDAVNHLHPHLDTWFLNLCWESEGMCITYKCGIQI